MKRVGVLIAAVMATVALVGCEEKDVYTVSQVEEIARYLDNALDPQELFSTENLVVETPFVLPFDNSAVYVDHLDSVKRDREIDVAALVTGPPGNETTVGPYLVDLGFGLLPYADVIYNDVLYITRRRTTSSDTTDSSIQRKLRRRGFMVKLGDNSRPYSGWVIWGFDGGTASLLSKAELTTEAGTVRADLPDTSVFEVTAPSGSVNDRTFVYTLLSDAAEVSPGGAMEIKTNKSVGSLLAILANYHSDAGRLKELLATPSNPSYYNIDTLHAAIGSSKFWHLVTFQMVVLESGKIVDTTMWCVPYRIEQ